MNYSSLLVGNDPRYVLPDGCFRSDVVAIDAKRDVLNESCDAVRRYSALRWLGASKDGELQYALGLLVFLGSSDRELRHCGFRELSGFLNSRTTESLFRLVDAKEIFEACGGAENRFELLTLLRLAKILDYYPSASLRLAADDPRAAGLSESAVGKLIRTRS